MSPGNDQPMAFPRLLELAQAADRQGRCRFTPFLTPVEAELALAAARRAGVTAELDGGYADAERRMARFCPPMEEPEPFPFTTLQITWPHQDAPAHRDVLGALMGLGIRRDRTGDITLLPDRGYVFVETPLAGTVIQNLTQAGSTRLTVCAVDAAPDTVAPQGEEQRFTVQSPRLDAIVADGFHLSRGAAAELIQAGAVKLRHTPTLRPDARVEAGDAISVRGYGRLRIEDFGEPTRKGRLPVRLTRFGASR